MRSGAGASLRLLVTGASGGLGSRLMRLASPGVAGVTVTGSLRRPPASGVPPPFAYVVGDYARPGELLQAFRGFDRLLFISSDGPRELVLRHHRNVIDAALAAGIRHITYTSIIDVADDSPFYFAAVHAATEGMLTSTPIPRSIVRHGLYADLLLPFVREAAVAGTLALPVSPTAEFSLVSRDDLARAHLALLQQRPQGGELLAFTGHRTYTAPELCEDLADRLQRRISFEPLAQQAYLDQLSASGRPDWLIQALQSLVLAVEDGRFSSVSTQLRELVGEPAETPSEFFVRSLRLVD